MSNKTRYIQSSQTFFHVYNRGADRAAIFFQERHYLDFVQRMKNAVDPQVLEIVAFCLMPNHYHLILYQKIPYAIPAFIRAVCEGYVKSVNLQYFRTGHLFEGRYRIKPITADEYLLHLARYIHRNPIRARLVTAVEAWQHSNYQCCISGIDDGVTSPGILLGLAGGTREYQKFVEEYVDDDRKNVAGMLF
ncbi:MAG: transposase [Bacteroidetes bacterium]|nr:transposase [Bacteroidota bacterium]